MDQAPGQQFSDRRAEFDESSGKLTLDLTTAYPSEAGLTEYIRSACIEDGRAVVCDALTSAQDGTVTFNLLCNCEPVFTGLGQCMVHGKAVHYDPALTVAVDSPDCAESEVRNIPESWDCDRLYRIRMTAPLKAGETRVFRIEVCR